MRGQRNASFASYPIIPVVGFRTVGRDLITEQGGFLIPKGSIIAPGGIALFQDPSLFPNPLSFQPSRWVEMSDSSKDAFFPFALGRRNCVGQSLALLEAKTVLRKLIKEFHFTVEDEGEIAFPSTARLDGCTLKVSKA